jgi:hypothetical protein
MTHILGNKPGNVIVPYASATKKTKWIDISSSITINAGTIANAAAKIMFSMDSSGTWAADFSGYINFTAQTNIAGEGAKVVSFGSLGSSFGVAGIHVEAYDDGINEMFVTAMGSGYGFELYTAATTARYLRFGGKVILSGEPTAYTIPANMEGVVAADVYIPFGQPGMPGEYKVAIPTYTNNQTNSFADVGDASLTLEKGTWELGYDAGYEYYNNTGSDVLMEGEVVITDNSNNVIANTLSQMRTISVARSGGFVYDHCSRKTFITISSTTTYKMRVKGMGTGLYGSVTANTNFYAVRLAP